MPIYEYECPKCGERFEKLVKLNAPTPECPKCGAAEVRKLVSAASFVLKGGGWYKDHYGLKPGGSSGESSSSSSSSSSSTAAAAPATPAASAPSTPSSSGGSSGGSTPASS